MRSTQAKRRSSVASVGFVATLAAVVCCASCGSSDTGPSPFGPGSSGGSSGGNGADGSAACVGFGCSVAGDDGGGQGFGDGGHIAVMDGGTVGGLPVGTIDQCTGSKLTPAMVTALQKGGPAGSMKWLYPYDKTVFPGGILAPVLQWAQSGTPAGLYVHMKSTRFEYRGCFAVTSPQFPLPQAVWTSAFTYNNGPADPVTVEMTTSSGGTVTGPIPAKWTLALGSLKGIVYYNTYTSQLTNPADGAVLSIAPLQPSPTLLLSITGAAPVGPCISCHSVSADGQTIAAQRHSYLSLSGSALLQSESYNLTNGAKPNTAAPMATNMTDDWGFSAVYPDGSRLLTAGQSKMSGTGLPIAAGNNAGMIGPAANKMFNPKTGATIAMSGLAGGPYAMMPMFSPDGKKLVFNDYDTGMGHTLAVMDFNPATNAFSNKKVIFTDSSKYAGWPFFTPDSKEVVFTLGTSDEYATVMAAPVETNVAQGDLYIVDVASGMSHSLDMANNTIAYPGRDEHLNFYTTVTPVAAGGYFWAYFTSRRNYGNLMVKDVTDATTKKLWVTAIRIGGAPGTDVSAPAFYLPGQELTSGNIRAFSTLAPCKGDNMSCDTGVDCCGQSCYMNTCKVPPGCSATDSKCTKAADCCDTTEQCINGFCAKVVMTIN